MSKIKIGILGTRGIPNNYGGYEQAATFLSVGLLEKGYDVTVYNSHNHPYRESEWNGVTIVRCFDPEKGTGTAGQFIYDLNCIRHARSQSYDVLLLLGYTSSSVWGRFYPKKTVIISNMDGLEWKRAKYSLAVQKYLRVAEKWAVQYSDYLVADSPEIRRYLNEKYNVDSCFIPYGAAIRNDQDKTALDSFGLTAGKYHLLIARMEPENNIEMILQGFTEANVPERFVVVGNVKNGFGRKMREKFARNKQILFAGSIFDQQQLHSLRAFASLYFHGHSVGGTNPSLLEAMASCVSIAAHDNPFNKAVLGDDASYFASLADIKRILIENVETDKRQLQINNNFQKTEQQYNWPAIVDQYAAFIEQCKGNKRK